MVISYNLSLLIFVWLASHLIGNSRSQNFVSASVQRQQGKHYSWQDYCKYTFALLKFDFVRFISFTQLFNLSCRVVFLLFF